MYIYNELEHFWAMIWVTDVIITYRPYLKNSSDQLIVTLYILSIYISVHNQLIGTIFEVRAVLLMINNKIGIEEQVAVHILSLNIFDQSRYNFVFLLDILSFATFVMQTIFFSTILGHPWYFLAPRTN